MSLDIHAGRSPGVVGESGSGKSTLARLVMALDTPSAGSVELLGRDLHRLTACELRCRGATCRWCSRTPTARWTCARRWRP